MGPQIHPQGGPQVSQAGPMMGGMMQGGGPPGVSGVGPSQHALSHLNPHQNPQLYAQQQQQMQHVCKLYVLFCHDSMSFILVPGHSHYLDTIECARGAVCLVSDQHAISSSRLSLFQTLSSLLTGCSTFAIYDC